MLKPEDIEIQVGRAVGGDFMNVVHKPTGICRGIGPPTAETRESKTSIAARDRSGIDSEGTYAAHYS